MADNSTTPPPSDRHRHAHRPAPSKRRRYVVLAGVTALVVAVIAVVLGVFSWDRSDDAVADQAVASPAASTTPTGPPATTPAPAPAPAPTPEEAAPTPEVPVEFAGAMQQLGIPLDPHTGWVVAQGICVRLGQPSYDQFRMSEGVERLFPSVSDEQAHAFVAMVAESVCHV
jgi:hypothetical protein